MPLPTIRNGDFQDALNGWRVISGSAFAQQPVPAQIRADDVEIDGRSLVPLGGNFWQVPFPIGVDDNVRHLVRVATSEPGVLDSDVFAIVERYLAFRLGGSNTKDAALEVRVPAANARTAGIRALDAPDADGFVAVRVANPAGSDVLREYVWDLGGAPRSKGLRNSPAKVRLRMNGTRIMRRPLRLAVAQIRLLPAPPAPFHPPLWGWADIHCHPMSQAAFGGLMAGHMHGPIEDLGSCLQSHGCNHGNPLRPVAMAEGEDARNDGALATTGWTVVDSGHPGLPGNPKKGDQLGFQGWPVFDDVLHIKTHQDWIKRAYDGGLRLMVALVVHNEMLASLTCLPPNANPQSDRDVVEPEIQMLTEFVVHNRAWCGLAKTPAEARALIEQNKMTFVLGLETDSVNGWIDDFETNDPVALRKQIRPYFEYLSKLGIAQINLVHLTDNAFGGMALYDKMFLANSFHRSNYRRIPEAEDDDPQRAADERIETQVSVSSALWDALAGVAQQAGIILPQSPTGNRNKRDMTPAGQVALTEAMRLGMMIDMDHMSEKCADQAYKIAVSLVPNEKYPLNVAHNGARKLSPRRLDKTAAPVRGSRRNPAVWPSEGSKSETQLDYVRDTGGIFGHGTAGEDSRDSGPFGGSKVVNDCPGSDKTFAQGYEYVAARLGTPVALGTDWNALLAAMGPRFGPRSANGLAGEVGQCDPCDLVWQSRTARERRENAEAQAQGVRYSTLVRDFRKFRFKDKDGLYNDYGGQAGTPLKKPDPGEGDILWQAAAVLEVLNIPGMDLTKAQEQAQEDLDQKVIQIVMGYQGASAGTDYIRAGFLAKDESLPLKPPENPHVITLAGDLRKILKQWKSMHAGDHPALERSTAGPIREFDFNLDGLAHYGLLPDMLQDLRNVGMRQESLNGLFQSAEWYIRVWEKCARVGAMIKP